MQYVELEPDGVTAHFINSEKPPYFDAIQGVAVEDDVEVGEGWVYDEETGTFTEPSLEDAVRVRRDELLRSSDPKALFDYPHASDDARTAWEEYRQELRNIPQQEGFPDEVTWPTAPE